MTTRRADLYAALSRNAAEQARDLGTVEIANVGGTPKRGDYAVTLRGTVHADATLRGVDRTRGHWPIVAAALAALYPEGPTPPPACPVGEPATGEALPGGAAQPEPVGGLLGPMAAVSQANPVGKRPGC